MIVNYTDEGWEVITQRAHGVLAAQLAQHWKWKWAPEHYLETILAIAEHDDAEMELDGEMLLSESGGPLNYSMKTFDPAHCRQLYEMALTKSRYIAILTCMHMDFLYHKEAAGNNNAANFLKETRSQVTAWSKSMGIKKTELEELYALMQWCDACSLLICQRQMPPEQRSVQISKGPGEVIFDMIQQDEKKLQIKPWPFQTESFVVNYDYRLVKQLQFASSAAFRKAFLAAPVTTQSFTITA